MDHLQILTSYKSGYNCDKTLLSRTPLTLLTLSTDPRFRTCVLRSVFPHFWLYHSYLKQRRNEQKLSRVDAGTTNSQTQKLICVKTSKLSNINCVVEKRASYVVASKKVRTYFSLLRLAMFSVANHIF